MAACRGGAHGRRGAGSSCGEGGGVRATCSPPPPTLLDAARARARRRLPLLASLSGARPGLELGAARLRRPCRTPRRAEAGRCRRPRVRADRAGGARRAATGPASTSSSLLSPPRSSFSLAPPLLLPSSRPRGAAPPPSPDPHGHRAAGRPPPAARGAPARARRGSLRMRPMACRPGRGGVRGSPGRCAAPPSPGGPDLASKGRQRKHCAWGVSCAPSSGCSARISPSSSTGWRLVVPLAEQKPSSSTTAASCCVAGSGAGRIACSRGLEDGRVAMSLCISVSLSPK